MTFVERLATTVAAYFVLATGYSASVHVLPDQWVTWLGWGLPAVAVVFASVLLVLAAWGGRGRHR